MRRCAASCTSCPPAPTKQLAVYLTHARALLFPSFAEGYGMPVVEALMLGTPAIASDLAVFRETAGEVPEYLDPLDGRGLARSDSRLRARRSPRRAAQLAHGSKASRRPTWERHFEQVEAFLEQLR
jgi:glycosyltransferase involved in cell wall biosynthesis